MILSSEAFYMFFLFSSHKCCCYLHILTLVLGKKFSLVCNYLWRKQNKKIHTPKKKKIQKRKKSGQVSREIRSSANWQSVIPEESKTATGETCLHVCACVNYLALTDPHPENVREEDKIKQLFVLSEFTHLLCVTCCLCTYHIIHVGSLSAFREYRLALTINQSWEREV